MDGAITKVSSFFLARKAKSEFSSLNDDINDLSTSVENGAKQLFNRLRGKMQKPLPDLLQSYDLPKGLFPRNATNYEFDESTGKLIVMLPFICEAAFRDTSILRYAAQVTGTLEKGKLSNVEGIKTKVVMWVKVTAISVSDASRGKVFFNVGIKKARPSDAYGLLRDGIQVDEY